ncbi:hypothetical protein VTO42DRAFT_8177 [Malbranchea cinnamomea]
MASKTKRGKTLAEQIAELEDPTPKDFDPEDLSDHRQSSNDESAGEDDILTGREHYEAVGKSKLRKPETIELGKEYKGSKISRDALYADESDNDPFRPRSSDESEESDGDEEDGGSEFSDEDEESDIEGDLEESDAANLKKAKIRKSVLRNKVDDTDESDVDMDDVGGRSESDDEGRKTASENDESEETDENEDEDEDEDEESGDESEEDKDSRGKPLSDEREELRRLMAEDHKTVAASISQAAKADAAKGLAVKRQRRAFDALLNARIKLQKGLTAANGLLSTEDNSVELDQELVKAAEAAALTLWNTLEELRQALANAQTAADSKKRKRIPEPTSATPSAEIWNRMREFESTSFLHRRAVLEKWSRKARGSRAALANARDKLLNTGGDQQSITAVLDAHVATEIELGSKRARREGEQTTSSSKLVNGTTPDPIIYDDTSFYHTLLRDLVEQRMAATNGGIGDNLHLQLPAQLSIHPVTGMRKDKVKRVVDTKASKGRKMRYNVHEKLQDFMVPEDRGSWGERARTEFFASLLGQSASAVLGEEEEEEADEDEQNLEEGGLRLFRS